MTNRTDSTVAGPHRISVLPSRRSLASSLAFAAAAFVSWTAGMRDAGAQPRVDLGNSTPAAAPAEGDASGETELSLEIVEEAEGRAVLLPAFLQFLRAIDPKATAEWDSVLGVLRIRAGGKDLQALSQQPLVIVENRASPVPRPLRARAGGVSIPLPTVSRFLEELGLEVEFGEEEAAPSGAPGTGGAALASPPGTPAAGLAMDSLLRAPAAEPAVPEPDIPKIDDGPTRIPWSRLIDAAHPGPPTRMTIVCDSELRPVADRVASLVESGLAVPVQVIPVPDGRRTSEMLVLKVAETSPGLALDLALSTAGPDDGWASRTIEIWVAHEALWTADAVRASGANAFRRHEYQGLAVASMLRREFAEDHPDHTVLFHLAPSYLLRRIDAPAATIVLPWRATTEPDVAARAIAGAVGAYSRGMRSASVARRVATPAPAVSMEGVGGAGGVRPNVTPSIPGGAPASAATPPRPSVNPRSTPAAPVTRLPGSSAVPR